MFGIVQESEPGIGKGAFLIAEGKLHDGGVVRLQYVGDKGDGQIHHMGNGGNGGTAAGGGGGSAYQTTCGAGGSGGSGICIITYMK